MVKNKLAKFTAKELIDEFRTRVEFFMANVTNPADMERHSIRYVSRDTFAVDYVKYLDPWSDTTTSESVTIPYYAMDEGGYEKWQENKKKAEERRQKKIAELKAKREKEKEDEEKAKLKELKEKYESI